jgi:hypothetical protein
MTIKCSSASIGPQILLLPPGYNLSQPGALSQLLAGLGLSRNSIMNICEVKAGDPDSLLSP